MVDLREGEKASGVRRRRPSFGDIVGQRELKEALLAVATDDGLDGLLVRGEKGTAKSTAVRALAGLFPRQEVIAGCPYGCPPDDLERQCADCRERADPAIRERPVPLVTLPLGATRERVTGTLSVADALDGDHEFDPGLLARANRGIMYVDEVNLLDDHLVDVLLDATASGVNRVERDGVSVTHPAEFTLVGTMNPEEGELRPQLRDRFALQVTVTGCDDLDQRVEIIDRALGATPADEDDGNHGERLRRARDRLGEVTLPEEFTEEIAGLCRDAEVEGHRADIATARAARTFAALDGRPKVFESDVRRAASLALPHRLRSCPFEEETDPEELVDDHFESEDSHEGDGTREDGEEEADHEQEGSTDGTDDEGGGDGGEDETDANGGSDGQGRSDDSTGDGGEGEPPGFERQETDEVSADPGDGDEQRTRASAATDVDGDSDGEAPNESEQGTPLLPGQRRAGVGESSASDVTLPDAVADESDGRQGRARTSPSAASDGPRVHTRRADPADRVDAAASVRAAAGRGASTVESRDLRRSVRQGETATLVLFVVDASASMRPAMRSAKGTVLELLKDAYRERDEVGFVAFAGDGADVLLPPTDSVTLAARHLKELPTGDRTPLPAGIRTAGRVLDRADPAASVVVLVTDGRANVAAESPVAETREAAGQLAERGAHIVVVDAGEDDRAGLAGLVAEETDGRRIPLDALSADRIDAAAGDATQTER